jgi:phage tail-like protein
MAHEDFDNSLARTFAVKIDGWEVPKIIEVSGLKWEVDKIDLKQQTPEGEYIVRQLIGRPKAGELTVTRGLTDNKAITDWLKVVSEGDVARARRTVAVELLDHQGEIIRTYNFVNCWVKSVEANSLMAGISEQATEKVVICYDEAAIS